MSGNKEAFMANTNAVDATNYILDRFYSLMGEREITEDAFTRRIKKVIKGMEDTRPLFLCSPKMARMINAVNPDLRDRMIIVVNPYVPDDKVLYIKDEKMRKELMKYEAHHI